MTKSDIKHIIAKSALKNKSGELTISINYNNSIIFNDKVIVNTTANNQSLEEVVKTHISGKNY